MKETTIEIDDAQLLATASDLRGVISNLRRRLNEQASAGDFTSSQASVLLRLMNHGPAIITELAHAEGVRTQSMSAIVSVLQAAGAIVGRPHPTDG